MFVSEVTLVDSNDHVIGYKKRSEVSPNDIYRVSALWVFNSNGQILLAQRSLKKDYSPGKWGPAVAGTVEEGENYESNIVKEAEEELGLREFIFHFGPKDFIESKYKYFVQWFMIQLEMDENEFHIDKSEVEQVKWFNEEELKKMVEENPKNFTSAIPVVLQNLDRYKY